MMLCTCRIDSTDYDVKNKVEFEDSDNSDAESDDGLFDFDDDDEVKAKFEWKLMKAATFLDNEGNDFASLKLKVKGKSKAVVEIERDENGHERKTMKSETKTKKVIYHLDWPEIAGEELPVEFENGNWQDWDRTWMCGPLEIEYDAKWGIDEAIVKNEEGCHPCKALIIESAMAYFFHPTRFQEDMESRVKKDARRFVRRHFWKKRNDPLQDKEGSR